MIPFLTAGALAASGAAPPLQFTGLFSTSSASSPITSSTRTINRAGTLLFESLAGDFPAGGTYSKNGGAFTAITEGLTLAMANGDTLAIRLTTGLTGSLTFNLRNNAGSVLIEAVTMTRT
jgi:hypothetical protein